MVKFKIEISKSVYKDLRKISKLDTQKIIEKVYSLSENPFPENCKKLVGEKNKYRIRQGNFRILYSVEKEILKVFIVKIAHRKNVYR